MSKLSVAPQEDSINNYQRQVRSVLVNLAQPVTFFLPSDRAVERIPEGKKGELLGNPKKLLRVSTSTSIYDSEHLINREDVKTVQSFYHLRLAVMKNWFFFYLTIEYRKYIMTLPIENKTDKLVGNNTAAYNRLRKTSN